MVLRAEPRVSGMLGKQRDTCQPHNEIIQNMTVHIENTSVFQDALTGILAMLVSGWRARSHLESPRLTLIYPHTLGMIASTPSTQVY